MKPSGRGRIDPFFVMEVMKAANERAAAGGDVIHMEVGQPSTPAPQRALEAATKAMQASPLGYTEALGIPELRAGISRHYKEQYCLSVPPERIVVTTGSSGGFLLAFLAALDHGQRMALGEPCYPAYRNILSALGIETVMLPTGPAERFQPTTAMLDAIAGPVHGLLVASPANPTGTMLDADRLRALALWCDKNQSWFVVDEIYHGITYNSRAPSVLQFTDNAIVINSFSKYFSMTGWRIGWMVVPEPLMRPVESLAQNLFISPPGISQVAALAALDAHDELDINVRRYAENRAILLEELPRAGFHKLAPADGAFYIYADVSHLTDDAQDFCRRMLADTGVAATPGFDFDRARGHHFVRFSFAGATADMAEAARRLKVWSK